MPAVENVEQHVNEQEQTPVHTAAEVELQRQLDVIKAQNEQLKETNAQLFRLAMGTQGAESAPPLQRKLQRFFDSHFNVAELSKEVK